MKTLFKNAAIAGIALCSMAQAHADWGTDPMNPSNPLSPANPSGLVYSTNGSEPVSMIELDCTPLEFAEKVVLGSFAMIGAVGGLAFLALLGEELVNSAFLSPSSRDRAGPRF